MTLEVIEGQLRLPFHLIIQVFLRSFLIGKIISSKLFINANVKKTQFFTKLKHSMTTFLLWERFRDFCFVLDRLT